MSAQTCLCKPHKKPYIKASQVFDLDIKQLYIIAGVKYLVELGLMSITEIFYTCCDITIMYYCMGLVA